MLQSINQARYFRSNFHRMVTSVYFNPLIVVLKPRSNGPTYSNTVIGTLAVDGWMGTARNMMCSLAYFITFLGFILFLLMM